MRFIRLLAALLLCCAAPAFATPPSDATIQQLLQVTNARGLLDNMLNQMDANMRVGITQSLQGREPNPAQQQAIDRFRQRTVAEMKRELSWDKLEAMHLRLYRETFTEEELTDILHFYQSPAGQAVIHKMPALMARSMSEVQTSLAAMMPTLLKIQQEFGEEMKAASGAGQ